MSPTPSVGPHVAVVCIQGKNMYFLLYTHSSRSRAYVTTDKMVRIGVKQCAQYGPLCVAVSVCARLLEKLPLYNNGMIALKRGLR